MRKREETASQRRLDDEVPESENRRGLASHEN